MKKCCESEAKKNINKHRDVATCDQCNALILAYAETSDFEKMVHQLKSKKVQFDTSKLGQLQLIIKPTHISPK